MARSSMRARVLFLVHLAWQAHPVALIGSLVEVASGLVVFAQAWLIYSIVAALVDAATSRAVMLALILAAVTGMTLLLQAAGTTARLRLVDAVTSTINNTVIRELGTVGTIDELNTTARVEFLSMIHQQQGSVGRSVNTWLIGVVNLTNVISLLVAATLIHLSLLIVPLAALPQLYLGLNGQRKSEDALEKSAPHGVELDRLLEPLTHSHGGDELRLSRAGEYYRSIVARTTYRWLERQRLATSRACAQELVGAVIQAGGLGVALYLLLREAQSPDAAAMVSSAIFVLVRLAATGALVHHTLKMLMKSDRAVARLCALLAEPLSQLPKPIPAQAGISVKNLRYRYSLDQPWALDDLTCDIPLGSTVAVVGENGSGKSTFGALLLGLRTPTSGTVSIPPKSSYAFVPQEPARLTATVFHNVGIGAVSGKTVVCTENQIEEALGKVQYTLPAHKGALMDTFLVPQREHTDASCLAPSGGQWKRIGIARALLREHATIQVFDEANAALDPEGATLIAQTIEASPVPENSIRIVITHNLGTARTADQILVLHRSKLVGSGTHEQLMRPGVCPHYVQLYRAQERGYDQ
ncbi:ABC transporter ATP-binding protein [Corynebacterium felinum]|nr:ABC transporter ATP-binding protein [Corynebacterium felinum]MDF5820467.1 ABC transporter ATP-binding protein [Corynebacterium felinum]